MKSLYRSGQAFEYRVRDALRAMGYYCLRSPQSRSPLDLVAIKRGAVLFVQCKRSGALGVDAWNALYELAAACGAIPLLASTRRRHVEYWRLLELKDGSNKPQPMGGFLPERY